MFAEPPDCLDEQTLAEFVSGELREQALQRVEAHLARCADCRAAVADAVHGADPALAATEKSGSSIPQVGDVLAGKYRIEGAIGRGGMGLVLAARHVALGHRVAIKILDSGDPTAGARFLREARTSAQLVNDHIVRVFDFGRLRSGVPYFVMEQLLGEDLQARMGRGSVPVPLAVEYMLQACAALREAHAAGVIHRDLKPSNLFIVARSDDKPWLKVLDFGISKLVESHAGRAAHTNLTQSQSMLGSPLYMSPEQIRSSKAIDGRTDIWSLGVILYELLTLQRPFGGPSVSAALVAISTEPVAPPSTLVPELPRELEAIVMRCLEKNPAARFANVGELVEALSPFTRPVVQVASAPPPHGKPPLGRRLALVTVPVLCLAAGIVWALSTRRQAATEPPHVEPPPEATSAAPAPLLRVRCDRPLPAGDVRWSNAARGTASAPRAVWPVAQVCDAESSPARQAELLAALAGSASSTAALEPRHPFYSIEWKQEPEQWSLALTRAAQARVVLQLKGVGCEQIERVQVRELGAPAVAWSAAAQPAPANDACRRSVELPFEAFGKRLGFQLEPAGFAAAAAPFEGDHIAVGVARIMKAVEPKRAPHPLPRRCLPPDEFCRD